MLYEVKRPATGLEVGETYSPEDLAKKGDVNNMVRKGIVAPVGFLSMGASMSDSEAARLIGELQKKLEATEDERDQARDEIRSLNLKIRSLEAGHREGAKELEAVKGRAAQLEAELALVRADNGRSVVSGR